MKFDGILSGDCRECTFVSSLHGTYRLGMYICIHLLVFNIAVKTQ